MGLLLLTGSMLRGALAQNSQQWSDFPPPGKKRGMYIDEAHNFVFALKNTYNPTTGTYDYSVLQELVDVITRKRLRYVALYNLDMGDYYGNAAVTPVLMDPDTWPALSALIGYLKSQQDSLEVGVVLSVKDTMEQLKALYQAYYFNYGVLNHVFLDNTGQFTTNSIICKPWLFHPGVPEPPFPPDPDRFFHAGELKRYALQGMMYLVMLYNYGRGWGENVGYTITDAQLQHIVKTYEDWGKSLYGRSFPTGPSGSPISLTPVTFQHIFTMGGYPHKFDWINIEWEYWNSPSKYNPPYPNVPIYQTNRDLWEAYVRLLKHARYVKCLSRDRLKLESYVELRPYLPGTTREVNGGLGSCWEAFATECNSEDDINSVHHSWDAIKRSVDKCPPSGYDQAEVLDTYLDRVLAANYFNLHRGLTLEGPSIVFKNRCSDFYFLGSPQSGKRTEVWPLFSLEYPLLNQLSCINPALQIPCENQFFGLALEPSTVTITSTICNVHGYDVPLWPGTGMGITYRQVENFWEASFNNYLQGSAVCDSFIIHWSTDWHNGWCHHYYPDSFFTNPTFWDPEVITNYLDSLYDSYVNNYPDYIMPYHPSNNPLGNVYGGFMYYTYSIQKCKPYYKKQETGMPVSTYLQEGMLITIGNDAWVRLCASAAEGDFWLLFDQTGRLMKQGLIYPGLEFFSVPVNQLSAGMYILKFRDKHCGERYVRIIIF